MPLRPALFRCLYGIGLFTLAALAVAAESATGPEEFTPLLAFRGFTRRHAHGLPQATVRTMVQDPAGVLWLGTMDGLARFDGNEMGEALPGPGQPPFGSINALALRARGGLFVGGTGGVHVYDGRTWWYLPLVRPVVSLAEQADGRLWMIDQGGTLWRTRAEPGKNAEWERIDVPLSGPATKVVVAPDGAVWIAGRSAVVRRVSERVEMRLGVAATLGAVTALMIDHTGACWIGTQAGAVLTAPTDSAAWSAGIAGPLTGAAVTALTEDARGRIWCGLQDGQLAHASPGGTWSLWGSEQGLNAGAGILSLLPDREGTLWIGQNARGVQQLLSESWRHRTLWQTSRASMPAGAVFGLAPTHDGRGVLAAVFNSGLWHWDGQRVRQYGPAEGLVENTRCAVEPQPGVLWVGARYGIYESHAGGPFARVMEMKGGFVTGFFCAPDGTWYAATSTEGVYVRRAGRWEPDVTLNSRLTNFQVRQLAWPGNGELWVSTNSGVTVFNGNSAAVLNRQTVPELPVPTDCVLAVGADEIWVGGLGGIAVRQGGKWRRWTEADGIPGRSIYSLVRAPDGVIWAGGAQGVGCYADGKWTLYDSRNGLVEEECNLGGLLVAPGGRVYVGTMGGLACFDPAVPAPLPVELRCVWRERPLPDESGVAALPAGVRTLHVTWAAPWLAPAMVEYRFRVLPLDRAWSAPTLRPELHIENLGAGTWTVEVQARLADTRGAAWSTPLRTTVTVAPVFLETIWAKLLGLVALAVLFLFGVRVRTWQLVRRERELERAVADAQSSVKTLRGLIPICASCKNIRDDRGSWNQLEAYVREHSEAQFSHGICPACAQKLYPQFTLPDTPPAAQPR